MLSYKRWGGVKSRFYDIGNAAVAVCPDGRP